MHDLEDGLIQLQGFLKKKPLLVVGSGLSISMGLPGMGELLAHLTETISGSCTSDESVEWDNCLTLIGQHGFEEGLGRVTISESLLSKIVNQTAELVGSRDSDFGSKLTDLQLGDFPFAKLLHHLMQSLQPLNPILHIVTPNYDHLVEYSCDLIGVNCATGFQGSHYLRFDGSKLREDNYRPEIVHVRKKPHAEYRKIPTVKLLKPHGSLNWHKINGTTYQSYKVIPKSTRVMITPGDSKYKASLTDNVMNSHRELANDCIANAESLVIIGYGFNDIHLQTVLLEKLKSGTDCLILTKGLSEGAQKVVQEFKQVVALEEEGHLGTRWYYDGNEGTWDEPLWDLSHFVKKTIGS